MPKSFPFYKQFEAADCGAACLRMIADFHGQKYSLKYLKSLTGASTEGVSLQEVSDASETLGFRTYGAEIDFETLKEDAPLPAIIFWQGYHFVVVYDVTDQKVVLGNPAADGIIEISKEEFIYNWVPDDDDPQGIALLLEPTPEFKIKKEDENQLGSIVRFIYRNIRSHPSLFWQLILGVLAVGLLQFSMPFLIMSMVDVGIVAEDMSYVFLILGGLLIFLASQVLVEFIRGAMLNFMGINLHLKLLTDFVGKMIKMPMQFFNSKSLGDIMKRISDSERLERFFYSSAMFSLFSLFNIVLYGAVLLIFDFKIFLVFVFGTGIYLWYIMSFVKKRRELNFKQFDQAALAHNYLFDIFSGIQDVKLFGAEEQRKKAWESRLAKQFRLNAKALQLEQWQIRGAYFINEFKNILILVVAADQVISGNMTLGMMLATMYIIGQLSAPVNYLVDFFQNYQEAAISYERMNEIEDEIADEDRNKVKRLPENGDITVENLVYQYGGEGSKVVLKNINLNLPKGKSIAIVGSNGAGKSTLVKLLLGVLKPSAGAVKIGDMSLDAIDFNYWLDNVAAVLHEGYIFSDTIAKNIALGKEEIDMERLKTVSKLVNFQNYVDELPQHYNTVLGEGGSGLSQGLRQRLLLARALYKAPEYLFLDEATNALDSYNETIIMENIREAYRDKTIIFVAHRIGTVSSADMIIVLEEGEIVEAGKHEELYAQQGAYFHLVKRSGALG